MAATNNQSDGVGKLAGAVFYDKQHLQTHEIAAAPVQPAANADVSKPEPAPNNPSTSISTGLPNTPDMGPGLDAAGDKEPTMVAGPSISSRVADAMHAARNKLTDYLGIGRVTPYQTSTLDRYMDEELSSCSTKDLSNSGILNNIENTAVFDVVTGTKPFDQILGTRDQMQLACMDCSVMSLGNLSPSTGVSKTILDGPSSPDMA